MHLALRAYVDCFHSSPFPKRFPRAGGVWEQDPELMRDFRIIKDYEVKWKETQEQLDQMRGKDPVEMQNNEGGGFTDLEDALNEYIEGLEEEDY